MGYLLCMALIVFGLWFIYNSAREKTGCGCLGFIVGTIVVGLVVFSVLH